MWPRRSRWTCAPGAERQRQRAERELHALNASVSGLHARVVLVFLDGVGIGPDDPSTNPFLSADLPTLSGLLGRIPTLEGPSPRSSLAACLPLDATLGVDGRPQSGTGQVALLAGLNAAKLFGRHFGPWTPVMLRPILAAKNVLKRAQERGRSVAFANAYPEGYPLGVPTRRQAAPPLAALSVGALNRHHQELSKGTAIASGIENTGWRRELGFRGVPVVSAERAGENLAAISRTAELTFFAHYDTDHAGHAGTLRAGVRALEKVDRFLGGLLTALEPQTTVLIASDHGNIEERTGKHTRNPVMGVVVRKAGLPEIPDSVVSIMDVAALTLGFLGVEPG